MDGLSGDPLNNRHVPLDGSTIASLLGAYLRNDPENRAYTIPPFRVEQIVSLLRNGQHTIWHGHNVDANIMEMVGGLYVLCMYLTVSPSLDEEVLYDAASVVHAAMAESIAVMQSDDKDMMKLSFLHPKALFPSEDEPAPPLLETFREALHLAKDIMRDMTRQIREAREPPKAVMVRDLGGFRDNNKPEKEKKKSKPPVDCWQAHSIYFMCCMGLAHLAGVLKSINNLNAVPGSMEALMIMSCLFPKKEEEVVVASSSNSSGNDRTALTTREERRKEKQLQSNDSSNVGMTALKTREAEKSRYEPCLKVSLKLGLAVIKYAFTPRALQELRLARQRLNRKLVHPDVEFARLKATQMKLTFLDRRFPFAVSDTKFTHSHRSQEYCKVGGANSLLPTWVSVNPLEKKKMFIDDFNASSSSSSQLQLPAVLGKPKSPLNNAKLLPPTKSVQPPTPLARESSASGQKAHQQQLPPKSSSAASSSSPVLLPQTPSKTPLAHPVGEAGLGEEEESEIRHFHALKKEFKQCYLATRTLRTNIDSKVYFDRDFKPAKLPSYDFYATGLSEKNLSVCVGEIESLIFHNYANLVCPRHLNPSQGLYWCAQFILEFLHQETFSGGGFDNSNDAVVKKLKGQVSALQQELVAGSKRGVVGGHHGPLSVADGGPKALVKSKQQPHKASSPAKLSLFEKLQLAAREANVEAQMDTLQAKMRDKGMMINKEERLAQIDKTLKSGIKTMRTIAAIQADMSEAGSDDEDDWMDEEISLSSQQKRQQQQQLKDVSDDHSNSTGSRRKNAAEKVTKFFDAKNDKHYFGAGPQDHLTEFLGNPMVREINYFRRMLKTVGLVENASGKNMTEAGNRSVSVIWSYTPTAEELQQKALMNRKARIGGGKISKEEEARLYAEEIHRFQKQKEEEDKDKAKEMEDSQEMEISKTRAYKLGVLQEARAHRKEMLTESAAIVKKKDEEQKMLARSENTRRKNEKKKLEDDKRLEAARIGDIRAWDRSIQQREADVAKERQEMEKIRLRNMASEKEYREIIRRNKEEARMKYLEERRRYLENRSEIEEAKAQAILDEKRRIFKAERILATARVRKGNFHHFGPDGKLAFYDDVRVAPVDWVQFEDASNVPYYFDPITKRTTYERPTDADVHHHSIDDRIAYDKEHGHGAYDEKNFNVAMKQSVNEFQGYYDNDGNWVPVNGWFDEYDVFWDYNIGWFDEQGKWNLRPVVTGDLSFMV